jgi:hypothetical protein
MESGIMREVVVSNGWIALMGVLCSWQNTRVRRSTRAEGNCRQDDRRAERKTSAGSILKILVLLRLRWRGREDTAGGWYPS